MKIYHIFFLRLILLFDVKAKKNINLSSVYNGCGGMALEEELENVTI